MFDMCNFNQQNHTYSTYRKRENAYFVYAVSLPERGGTAISEPLTADGCGHFVQAKAAAHVWKFIWYFFG